MPGAFAVALAVALALLLDVADLAALSFFSVAAALLVLASAANHHVYSQVPVVKDVQAKSVFEVAAALRELQQLGAANKLGEQHLTGGTISLSNMGSIGGTYLKPVILAPQTAIVALGRIQTLPRQQAHGSVGLSKVMVANWAGDHRVIDGATMGRFVNTWKALLENPTNMLAHLK
mmetsp:Transcript_66223/g.149505  ORF Transcript_66223/g.149505 Transcript_66223/m.149505 type:complete len:176 (-) Transcript_66223:318-845(-)